jgi:hypothetical protein
MLAQQPDPQNQSGQGAQKHNGERIHRGEVYPRPGPGKTESKTEGETDLRPTRDCQRVGARLA